MLVVLLKNAYWITMSVVEQEAGSALRLIKPLTLLPFIEIAKRKRVETYQADGHDSFFSRNR
jgi:hypothetical protein